jgi:hypothetical protein
VTFHFCFLLAGVKKNNIWKSEQNLPGQAKPDWPNTVSTLGSILKFMTT